MSVPALVFGVVGVLVPLKLDNAGWSATAIAVAWVVSAAIEMVLAPLIGRVSDRKGRLLPLRVALMGAVAVLVGFAFADRPGVVVPILILSGITFGGFWAPAMALLSDAADRIGLAQGLAFGLMNVAWGAGNAARAGHRWSARGRGGRRASVPRPRGVLPHDAREPRLRWHSAHPSARKFLIPFLQDALAWPLALRYLRVPVLKSDAATQGGTLNGPAATG